MALAALAAFRNRRELAPHLSLEVRRCARQEHARAWRRRSPALVPRSRCVANARSVSRRCYENLVPRLKEIADSGPLVCNQASSGPGCFKNPGRRRESNFRHRISIDVQHHPCRTVHGVVMTGANVPDPAHVCWSFFPPQPSPPRMNDISGASSAARRKYSSTRFSDLAGGAPRMPDHTSALDPLSPGSGSWDRARCTPDGNSLPRAYDSAQSPALRRRK